jgi:putative endonuclease
MEDARKNLGKLGEKLISKYLKEQGYQIIDQNYRTRYGEIDIVAKDGDFFVFVEVKTRTNRMFGFPEEAIDARKQHKLAVTAEHYLASHHLYEKNYRIDSVAVEINEKDGKTQIRHEKDVVGW